jgi:excinuclease ABC subunit C
MLDARDPVLLPLTQRWRDEAHRFAITRHRGKRAKAIGQSVLDAVRGSAASARRRS